VFVAHAGSLLCRLIRSSSAALGRRASPSGSGKAPLHTTSLAEAHPATLCGDFYSCFSGSGKAYLRQHVCSALAQARRYLYAVAPDPPAAVQQRPEATPAVLDHPQPASSTHAKHSHSLRQHTSHTHTHTSLPDSFSPPLCSPLAHALLITALQSLFKQTPPAFETRHPPSARPTSSATTLPLACISQDHCRSRLAVRRQLYPPAHTRSKSTCIRLPYTSAYCSIPSSPSIASNTSTSNQNLPD
jgi:hypothetical protein